MWEDILGTSLVSRDTIGIRGTFVVGHTGDIPGISQDTREYTGNNVTIG